MHFAISDLEIGMEVAQEVTDSSGRIFVGVGVRLTERHLEAFYACGIASVSIFVEGEGDKTLRDLSQEEMHAIQQRFSHLDLEHPFGRVLFDKCVELEREGPPRITESD